jgi:hypothetical protein
VREQSARRGRHSLPRTMRRIAKHPTTETSFA